MHVDGSICAASSIQMLDEFSEYMQEIVDAELSDDFTGTGHKIPISISYEKVQLQRPEPTDITEYKSLLGALKQVHTI